MGYDQEKQRASHMILLICYTIFLGILAAESLLLGWDVRIVVQLAVGLVLCWFLHITGKLEAAARQMIYFALTMCAFVFYGIHESSIYDSALVMAGIIVIYYAAEIYSAIRYCVLVYFLTMAYDLIFVVGRRFDFSALSVSRTLLHFGVVILTGYLSEYLVRKRRRELKDMTDRIAELEAVNRRTEDFLTNVSHELRTPINAVTGLTSVMLKNEDNEEKRQDLIAVQNAGMRLFGQIEDILDYTEIDTGKMQLSEENYMIASLVNDVLSGNRVMERADAPELVFDVDPKIPSMLFGDVRKIKKIIRHLIDNAMKFTHEGGVYVRIHTLPKPYGANLRIRVSDTGIGIGEEDIEKISEKFYQSSAGRNRKAGGLGLGLPIVQGMAAAMEGFVQVESGEGRGTTVTVSIPQKVVDASPAMTVANQEKLCLACYLRPEKYKVTELRNYYNELISNMVGGLDVSVHRVFELDELEKLVSSYQLTHLFIGKEEYEENTGYFESMDPSTHVVVVADAGFSLPHGSRLTFLPKPFWSFSVAGILNAEISDEEKAKGERMICPELCVLVVDDEPMNLMVAEGIFKDYGMTVRKAESGRKAIQICENEEFDLIFLDHMMPEMDGVETLKNLRLIPTASGNPMTIIAFTANAVSGAREMLIQEGFDEFVSKPVERIELERVLKKVLPKTAIEYVPIDEAKQAGSKGRRGAKSVADANNINIIDAETVGASEEEILEAPESSWLDALAQRGFNVDAGLGYCQNDEDFYRELLQSYVQDAAEKQELIQAAYEKKDYADYRIRVHALKSTSKMTGADELSEMARLSEEAAKNLDADYIDGHHGGLLEAYRGVIQAIADAAGIVPVSEAEPEDGAVSGEEISKEELLNQLEAIRECLDTFEEDKAEELIAEKESMVYQNTSVRSLLEAVKRDVQEFEFDAASEKTAALIDRIKG